MHRRLHCAFQQLEFLWYELSLLVNSHKWRWVSCLFSPNFHSVAAYRLDRFFYLLLGRAWPAIRVILSPILFFFHPWFGRCEIHYRAQIDRGLKILHPALGVVISGHARIGKNLTLTGGNCLGNRLSGSEPALILGDYVELGANAVVIGPAVVGSHVKIGAGAVVVKDICDHQVVVGVPARPIHG